jgi:hypothetical protein
MQTANSTLSGEFIGSLEPLPQSHRVDFLVSLFEARREILLALDSGILPSNRYALDTEDFEFLLAVDALSRETAGGVTIIRKLFPQKSPANGGDEKEWIYAYIKARKNWLLSSSNQLVRNSASRMDSLKAIADSNNWELNTPLTVKGVKIQ